MSVPAVGHDASQKQYDLFIKELVRRDMDINQVSHLRTWLRMHHQACNRGDCHLVVAQPTPNGKLPIIEAVKTGDLRFVEAVIQVGFNKHGVSQACQSLPLFTCQLILAHTFTCHVQAQATIKVKEPSSGVSPVFVAFQTGQAEVRGRAARTHALVRPA